MLLAHAARAIRFTDLQKKSCELLDRIATDEPPHFVVMRDNKPAAVMMAAERYEALIGELDDLRTEAVARARSATPREIYLSQKEMDVFVDSL